MNEGENITLKLGELKAIIQQAVKDALDTFKPKKTKVVIDRQEVADMFGISLVTLHQWMKEGILPYYTLNRRVYFKKSEIFKAMEQFKKNGGKDNEGVGNRAKAA